jgi:predicted ATPase
MLKRVAIEGFRSCHDVVLDDLGPLTVLVGRNAVGKSNILRAISWLAKTATSSTPPADLLAAGGRAVGVQIILGDDTYDYSFHKNVRFSGDPPRPDIIDITETLWHQGGNGGRKEVFQRRGGQVTLEGEGAIHVNPLASCMTVLVSLLPHDSERVRLVRPLLENLRAIRYYPVEVEADLGPISVRQSEYQEWLTQRRGAGSPVDPLVMRLLDMRLNRPDEFDEVQQLLGPNGLGLIGSIRAEPFGPVATPQMGGQSFYFVSFQPSLQPTTSPPLFFGLDELSSGTQRLIGIITSLIYDHSAVMLLEHPEEGIHRALLIKLIDLLQGYSDQSQLIVATHSASVLNAVPPDAIRLVTMENGPTQVRRLTGQESQAAAKYLEEEGTLSDFLEMVAEE